MKKMIWLVLTALFLSACTPKAYAESLDAGKAALQKGDYDKAINNFENALEEKKTDEAENYLHITKTLLEGQTLYRKGNFDEAAYSIKKLLQEKSIKNVDEKIIKQANALLKEIQAGKKVSDSIKEKMIKGKTLLENQQYDQAAQVFKEIAETTDLPDVDSIETIAKDAAKLLDETTKKKNDVALEEHQQEAATEKNDKEEKKQTEEETNNSLTHEQAQDLVRKHLNLQSDPNVKVFYDHDADNGDYIIHVYEFVVDNPSTGEGHNTTMGWYGVNKQTKAVYDAMK